MVNYNKYQKACNHICKDEALFLSFKRNPAYRYVLEHVSVEQGYEYINQINKKVPGLFRTNKHKFATNDAIGKPRIWNYTAAGFRGSPTTLRYIKVLSDLIELFGSLDGLDIIEIGCGYGGQCKIIYDIFKPKSYTLVDLPEVLQLSNKYLDKFDIYPILRSSKGVSEKQYDLCISNYAFSEFDRKSQDFYVENIIKRSTKGYMTLNFLGLREEDNALTEDEIKALKVNYTTYPEIPITGESNLIYTWK